jgi:hypothetical protein
VHSAEHTHLKARSTSYAEILIDPIRWLPRLAGDRLRWAFAAAAVARLAGVLIDPIGDKISAYLGLALLLLDMLTILILKVL